MKPLRWASSSLAALIGFSVCATAMPLQTPTGTGDPAVGASRVRPYSLADEGAIGGRSGSPETVPQWVREQEVYQKRAGDTLFTVRMENISPPDALAFADGTTQAVGASHGVYAVWREVNPVIQPNDFLDFGTGLEALAEDGNVRPLQAYLRGSPAALETGIFYKPVGASKDEELWPGKVYEFSFTADSGDKLSFVTMLMQSNDLVYAPEDGALELFDAEGRPVTGDISDRIVLYDVGTEVNQDPKTGPDTGMNQDALNSGPMEDDLIRPIDDVEGAFPYPPPESVLKVTIRKE